MKRCNQNSTTTYFPNIKNQTMNFKSIYSIILFLFIAIPGVSFAQEAAAADTLSLAMVAPDSATTAIQAPEEVAVAEPVAY